ncbi:MAG: hypothetical protein V8Q75_03255 [Bacilli bacterium]
MLDLGIELYVKETTAEKFSATKLVAVKGAPATGQAGGTVEITTSSDPVKVYIPDRPDTGDMDFTYNYSEANLTAVKAVCDNVAKDILIKYPDGTGSMYTGICQTWKNEVSVGGAIECTLHTVPSTLIADKSKTEVSALISAT